MSFSYHSIFQKLKHIAIKLVILNISFCLYFIADQLRQK